MKPFGADSAPRARVPKNPEHHPRTSTWDTAAPHGWGDSPCAQGDVEQKGTLVRPFHSHLIFVFLAH